MYKEILAVTITIHNKYHKINTGEVHKEFPKEVEDNTKRKEAVG